MPHGLPINSPRLMAGSRRRDTSFAIGIASMARSSCAAFERWAFGIGRSHRDRLGRTDMRRGLSARSGGTALTTLLCSVTDIFVTCSARTRNTTTMLARTYRCTRMHRSRAPCRSSVARWPCPFWADCTTNISEHEFPTGTGSRLRRTASGDDPVDECAAIRRDISVYHPQEAAQALVVAVEIF